MSLFEGKGKLILNSLLAGLWVALAAFVETESFTADAALAALTVGLRLAIGLIAAAWGKPVPVDQ